MPSMREMRRRRFVPRLKSLEDRLAPAAIVTAYNGSYPDEYNLGYKMPGLYSPNYDFSTGGNNYQLVLNDLVGTSEPSEGWQCLLYTQYVEDNNWTITYAPASPQNLTFTAKTYMAMATTSVDLLGQAVALPQVGALIDVQTSGYTPNINDLPNIHWISVVTTNAPPWADGNIQSYNSMYVDTIDNTPYFPVCNLPGFLDYATRSGTYYGQLVTWSAETYMVLQTAPQTVTVFPDGFTWGFQVQASAPRSPITLTASGNPNPVVVGQPTTLTALLDTQNSDDLNRPTGMVGFLDRTGNVNTLLGFAPVQPNNSLQVFQAVLPGVTFPNAGEHNIAAQYMGDSYWYGSVATILENVIQANTSLDLTAPQSAAVGASIDLAATVSVVAPGAGAPTGTITFYADANSVGSGSVDASGTASISVSSLAVGSHLVTATYAGDNNSFGSSAATNLTITADSVTVMNLGDQTNTAGASISLPLTAWASNGDPVTLSETGLPPGLSISNNAVVGAIALNAGSASPYTVTLTATDVATGVSASVSIIWTISVPTIGFMPPGDQANDNGDTVNLSLVCYAWTSNGDPLTFSASGLPPGLTLSNGVIAGTLTTSGTYSVTLTATDPATDISATQTLTWTVT